MDATLQAAFDRLTAAIATLTTDINAAKTLMQGQAAQISALEKTPVVDPTIAPAIDAITATIASDATGLGATVVANTPVHTA